MHILGIDVGGSGIKGALVDLEKGELVTERHRIDTPKSQMPDDVLPVLAKMVDFFDYRGPLGVGLPTVVANGVVKIPYSAHNIEEWVGLDVKSRIAELTGCETSLVNDADAAGLAEMRYGAGRDNGAGTVILLTLGTGIGSAIFVDGKLIPNTELGKLYLRDKKHFAEYYAAERARDLHDLSWKKWAGNLDDFLNYVAMLFTPQLFIVGGGVSKKPEKFVPHLTLDVPLVPAELRNEAGIVGAALATQG